MTATNAEIDTADPFRILIVEDDRSQALFAEAILRGSGMQAEVVAVPEQVMATMERLNPDLVLMDLHMPGISGTTLTAHIREHPRFLTTPVVFLTGEQDPDKQLEVLESGADDYLLKPVRPRHLIAAVQSRVKRARAAQARQAAAMAEPERHPVTGLYTRPALMRRLAELLPSRHGGALLLEVGNAGVIRNRYGYSGFEQLMNDAGRLVGQIASSLAAARLSDNAFLIVAADHDDAQLQQRARNLRDGIGYHDFQVGEDTLRLRCAIGYADFVHGFADAGAALAGAEVALRDAHSEASGIFAFVPPPATPTDGGLAREIREALEGDGLLLAFQPIVAVAGGDEAQFQVLMRLRDSNGREHSAGEVIPVADASGLLPQMDRWVMQEALALLQRRRADGRPVRLFVSQAPRTLAQDSYADWLLGTLEAANVDGPSLVIDIRLEDAQLHSMLLRQFSERLVPAGVQLCLTQYRHSPDAEPLLHQLPLGYVRLSADYARPGLTPEMRDEMRTAIERAHRLGLQVIGQRVEDPQSAAALWMSGIDYIQGNLVQRAEHELDFDFQNAIL